jgi:beta-lactamase regulating signal transducer with metallopeptidase domain
MFEFVDYLNRGSAMWVERTGAVLWQSFLLVGLVTVLCQWLRRSNPAVRYWLWQIVAIKLIVMPLWTVSLPVWWPTTPVEAPPANGPELAAAPAATAAGEFFHFPFGLAPAGTEATPAPSFSWFGRVTWQSWLLVAWLSGVMFQGIRLVMQRRRLSCLLRQSPGKVEPHLAALVRDVAARLGLANPPRIAIAEYRGSPFVCGIRRPVLVLPAHLFDALDHTQLRLVLLHELAHLQRHDLVWGWISEIARVVYFFHPLVYYARYRIRLERELACDQIAMQVGGGDAADYADTLVSVMKNATRFALPTPALLAKESHA